MLSSAVAAGAVPLAGAPLPLDAVLCCGAWPAPWLVGGCHTECARVMMDPRSKRKPSTCISCTQYRSAAMIIACSNQVYEMWTLPIGSAYL
jgi:hypothetical protein